MAWIEILVFAGLMWVCGATWMNIQIRRDKRRYEDFVNSGPTHNRIWGHRSLRFYYRELRRLSDSYARDRGNSVHGNDRSS